MSARVGGASVDGGGAACVACAPDVAAGVAAAGVAPRHAGTTSRTPGSRGDRVFWSCPARLFATYSATPATALTTSTKAGNSSKKSTLDCTRGAPGVLTRRRQYESLGAAVGDD